MVATFWIYLLLLWSIEYKYNSGCTQNYKWTNWQYIQNRERSFAYGVDIHCSPRYWTKTPILICIGPCCILCMKVNGLLFSEMIELFYGPWPLSLETICCISEESEMWAFPWVIPMENYIDLCKLVKLRLASVFFICFSLSLFHFIWLT